MIRNINKLTYAFPFTIVILIGILSTYFILCDPDINLGK